MAYNKARYITDIELVPSSRSKYIKEKSKYIGKQYNSLILKDIVCDTKGYVYGVCDCIKCGNKNIITAIKKLLNYETFTCGCSRNTGTGFNSKYDSDEYIGKIFKNLRVDGYYLDTELHKVMWKMTCILCGNQKIMPASFVVNGTTTSCGCILNNRNNKYSDDNWLNKDIDGTIVLKILNKDSDGQYWLCRCKYCNKEFKALARKIVSRHTNSCGCMTKSIGVYEIEKYLNNHNIRYISEWKSADLLSKYGYQLRIDIVLVDKNNNILGFIEYDGDQHNSLKASFGVDYDEKYHKFMDLVDSDNRKDAYAKINNIPMLRISYNRNSTQIINELKAFINKLNIK